MALTEYGLDTPYTYTIIYITDTDTYTIYIPDTDTNIRGESEYRDLVVARLAVF